jgi:hypothetical protein
MASSETANATSSSATAPSTSQPRPGGWDEKRAAANPTAQMSDIDRLRFEATINGRYHTSRQGWYELMHRCCMFVVVIGGAGAVAEAVGTGSRYSWVIALIPTVAGTIDLVFDFSAKAAQHARLQEKSYEIVADIEQLADAPEAICRRGWAAIARICAQETKTMRAVQALAYNDTKQGSEKNVEDELLLVPIRARLLKHIWAFDGLLLNPPKKAAAST